MNRLYNYDINQEKGKTRSGSQQQEMHAVDSGGRPVCCSLLLFYLRLSLQNFEEGKGYLEFRKIMEYHV